MNQEIKERIPELINTSGYRDDFIAKKIGMTPVFFSVKKQRGNWSEKEVNKIMAVLTGENDEVFNLLMLEEMRIRKDDETITLDELKKQIGWT